jgi:uncharacterized metal-binding protein YceD (DUF177 family)
MQNLFSYPLKLEDMSASVQTYNLQASSEDLKFITEIMQVPAVKSFNAEIKIRLRKKEYLANVWGKVEADVEHRSVVSLDNFVKNYQTDFSLDFDTKMTLSEQARLEEEGEDVLDILDNGQIDLAAIAMEQLALILDDFPRKEGEIFTFKSEFDEETTIKNNPFAVLEKLKK